MEIYCDTAIGYTTVRSTIVYVNINDAALGQIITRSMVMVYKYK